MILERQAARNFGLRRELAGLEPATSWVRSMSRWGLSAGKFGPRRVVEPRQPAGIGGLSPWMPGMNDHRHFSDRWVKPAPRSTSCLRLADDLRIPGSAVQVCRFG
jgi:hypothetical protein